MLLSHPGPSHPLSLIHFITHISMVEINSELSTASNTFSHSPAHALTSLLYGRASHRLISLGVFGDICFGDIFRLCVL